MNEKYSLIGIDGNAYSIMGYVSRGMRECGKPKMEIDAYFAEAKSADYNHLLVVSVEMIDKLNEEALNVMQVKGACLCPIPGMLLELKPDPANKGKTKIWIYSVCSSNKR
jgi:hypothetical protein